MFKKYQCHKTVLAEPMTRGEYNMYRGWGIPMDENPNDEGYLVEYLDSPTTDMPHGHTNYISWSPKDVFEKGYSEEKPFDTESLPTLKYFAYTHLPDHLKEVSKPIAKLAQLMNELPNGPEKSAGMRKLLEAKDCFVRAKLD